MKYSEKLERLLHAQTDLGKRVHGVHVGLYGSLNIAYEFATETNKVEGKITGHFFKTLHRGLCVLQEQASASVTMLSCLWGVEEETVEGMLDVMEDLSVCRIEEREVNGGKMLGIRIHDLIHDHCMLQAGKHDRVRQWHEEVVEVYRRRYKICGGNDEKDGKIGWWSEKEADDSYTHTNLARHLVESGKADELTILMLNYR